MAEISFRNLAVGLFIASLFVVTFSQQSFAAEITYPVNSGPNTLTFRDILNTDPTPVPTLSLDKDFYLLGENAVLTINDFNANTRVTIIDFATAIVVQGSSSSTVFALETGISTAVFNESFLISDVPSVSYFPDPPEVARASATLDLASGGSLSFADFIFDQDFVDGLCFRPIIYPVDITLSGGAALDTTDTTVTLSYANSLRGPLDFASLINMFYLKSGTGTWEKIRDEFRDSDAVDFSAKTVSSNLEETSFGDIGGTITTGKFVLGMGGDDCGGGGGGGLVRPSLVVNALAGIGGGFGSGGGSAYSSPTLQLSNLVKLGLVDVPFEVEQMIYNHDSTVPAMAFGLGFFEDFDYPLIINDKGFILSGYSTTIDTQTLQTNTLHTFKFLFYESDKIQHFSLYTNLRGANSAIHQSDTQILYNDGQEVQVVDPNGFFEGVSLTLNEIDDIKKQIVLEITFAKEMETTDMIVRSWDPFLNSFDTYILDAFEVVSDTIEESTTPTFEAPVFEELESQSIPKWIKNNAAWWSDQQISDSDFVSGIEYLIRNGIINVPGVEVGTSSASTEIPDWIQNNAGWWAESLITDGDFTEAMQWLIANGVIQI